MMLMQNNKNKVALSDFNYQRDIQNRMFLARMTEDEISLINEIVNNSLRIPIFQLLDAFGSSKNKFDALINKLIENSFITLDNDEVVVNKDLRRYYEGQLLKFEPDFVPGIDYLHSLLHQVPIHILPSWYAIPRTTDNIFEAIVDKFLSTPKVYERYLEDVEFDSPVLKWISKEVFSAPDFCLTSRELMQKFDLTHSEFEECILILEYHFICFIGYRKRGHLWEEIVTPFHEWREYLRHKRDTHPKKIESDQVADIQKIPVADTEDFVHSLSLVEKSLVRIIEGYWTSLDDFMRGFISSPIAKDMVALKHKGKKWKYELPTYSQQEMEQFQSILCEELVQAGIISLGTFRGKRCIKLTPYGQMILSEQM